MRKETRIVYNGYLKDQAELNDVPSVTEKFAAAPSVQQTLEDKIQDTSAFLNSINVIGVAEQTGEKIGLGVSGPSASTTNTATTDRSTTDISTLDDAGYACTQTNFDTHITYAKLDAWAKFNDFQIRLRNAIVKRQALDRIMTGFNGTSRSATSDPVTNPLRQDVNIGWLQKHRVAAPARVMAEGANAGAIRIGAAAGRDYFNIDALVMDLVNEMIEPWYQEDTELVVICGRALMADKYFPLVNQANANTEAIAADLIISQKRIGNLPAMRVPYFPANSLMVTRLDNLSLYWQEGSRRRTIVDNAKRDRIENYESSNDAYVVEDHGCCALAENITATWV